MLRLILLTTAVLYMTQINGASIVDDVTKTAEELGEIAINELFKSLDEVEKIEKESGTLSQRDMSIIECAKFLKNVKDAKEESEKAINDTRKLVEHFKKEAEGRMEQCIKTQTVQPCLTKEKLEELGFAKKLNDYRKKAEKLTKNIQNSFNECKKLMEDIRTTTERPNPPQPAVHWLPIPLPIHNNNEGFHPFKPNLIPSATSTAWGILGGLAAMIPRLIPFLI